jgi:hypothetical protein
MKKSTLSRSLRGASVVRRAKILRLQSSGEACASSADFVIDIAELIFGTHLKRDVGDPPIRVMG